MEEETGDVHEPAILSRNISVESVDRVEEEGGGKENVDAFHKALQPYVTETELIKLLADERLRNSQHRLNYQDLKTMLLKLQREVETKDDTLRSLDVEIKQMQSAHEQELEQLRSALRRKEADIMTIQSQVPSEYELELERIRVTREAEEPLRARVKEANENLESLRQTCVQLEYENSLLRGELEHSQKSAQRILEETKLKYQLQISLYDKEREDVKSREDLLGQENEDIIQNLKEELSSARQQMRTLDAEREALMSQKLVLQQEKHDREALHLKQITQLDESKKALQGEKFQLSLKIESTEKELNKQIDLVSNLESKLNNVKGQLNVAEKKLEETCYQQRRDQANSKVENARLLAQANKQKDSLASLVEDLESRLDTENLRIQQLEGLLSSKEQEIQGRVETARQNEQHKIHKLNMDNTELLAKLQVLEREKSEFEKDCERKIAAATKTASQISNEKLILEREILNLKDRLLHLQDSAELLDKEKNLNNSLKTKLSEMDQLSKITKDQEIEMKKLKELQIEDKSELMEKSRALTSLNAKIEQQLAEQKSEHEKQIECMQETLEKLHADSKNMEDQLKGQRKKNHMYAKLIKKLRGKLEKQQEQVELSSQHGWVPGHLLEQANKQLSQWKLKHEEFKSVLDSLLLSQNSEGVLQQISALQQQLSHINVSSV